MHKQGAELESIVEYGYNIMEDNHPPERQRGNFSAFNVKYIQNWDDFRKTFRPTKFDHSLNAATLEELHAFWNTQLQELTAEPERICILVPSRVARPQNDLPSAEEPKKASKNAHKQGKNSKPAEVALEGRVMESAMQLVRTSFPQLDFDYASLFLGNDKQLLIYRRCTSIEKYIEKYRLPKAFEAPFEELSRTARELYELRTDRNRAFSTFNAGLLQRTQKQAETAQQRMKERLQEFKPLFRSILTDFLAKPKCKELILHNAPQELIESLRQACVGEAEIINRFTECDNDEYRDVIVVKLDDPRLRPFDPADYEEKVEYVYVEAQPTPEPPKDIRDLIFVKIDLQKQCYRYRIELPSSGKYNPIAGLFLRSEQGSESFELTVELKEGTREVEVDVYPYQQGKSVYEIFTWNQHGFTKSTERIVLFNEMPLPSTKAPPLKNRKVYLLGETQCGLFPERTGAADQLLPFVHQERQYFAKDLSLANAAIICDVHGDVAGWGEMYFPDEEKPQKPEKSIAVEELVGGSLRVDPPCLLLPNKQIRKVSCGNGYCLMASSFGAVFSMGCNHFGQLGLGHFNAGKENMDPAQICKFTNAASPFIVDVQASVSGASFAVCSSGVAYRWGYNQVEETQFPILDRFGSIINYSSAPLYFKSAHPAALKKHHIPSSITQIQAGSSFFLALDTQGLLYGWGECRFLGVAELKDREENTVADIVNPIQIAKNIESVSAGFDHCVATTKDGRILGWGNTAAFSKKQHGFASTPVDVTEEYGGRENVRIVRAGRLYTALLTDGNTIRIVGQESGFKREEYAVELKVADLACSYESFIGVLAETS